MKRFLKELGLEQDKYLVYCGSQSVIHLAKNPSFHSKSKHIDIRYHWIQDVFEKNLLHLAKISINDNGADMLTKALSMEKQNTCRQLADMDFS
jgi:hypothetical protein